MSLSTICLSAQSAVAEGERDHREDGRPHQYANETDRGDGLPKEELWRALQSRNREQKATS